MDNTSNNIPFKKKILIVEDDFYIRDIYELQAKHEGYDVMTAADGEEALKKVRSELPDLVLLDLMLPKVDGMTVLKTIKQDPQLQKIPCVVLTNLEDSTKEQEALSLGAAAYLLKIKYTPGSAIETLKKYF